MRDSRRYVLHPAVSVLGRRGRVRAVNQAFGTWLETSAGVRRLIEFFRRPAPLSGAPPCEGVDREAMLTLLVDNYVIVPHAELAMLSDARTRPAPSPIGAPCSATALALTVRRGTVVVIGAPVDSGARVGGARHGPDEIRSVFPDDLRSAFAHAGTSQPVLDFDFGREYDIRNLQVLDLGDVDFKPGESLAVVGARLGKIVGRCADLRATPVVLGGDHSISAFSAGALLERHEALGIIHFDAHHDVYAHPLRQLTHATSFAHLLARSSLRQLLQIGLRTVEQPSEGTRRVRDSRLHYVSARAVTQLSPSQVFRRLNRRLPYYLSFDVDCLDPLFASATGTRMIGGLSFYQAINLIDYAARTFHIVGADFVETSKSSEKHNLAALASARCLLQLLVSRCRARRLANYAFAYPP